MNSADKVSLLPCPFCGGEAERFTLDDEENFGGDVICCKRCQASSHVEFGRKENLVEAWNTRSTPATEAQSDRVGEPVVFGYTNWRGEYAERSAIPLRIERKESEWHGPGLHWVMVAFDIEKQAERDFLLKDMGTLPAAIPATEAAPQDVGVRGDIDHIALDLAKRIEREFYYDQPGGAVQTRAKVQAIIAEALSAIEPQQEPADAWNDGYTKGWNAAVELHSNVLEPQQEQPVAFTGLPKRKLDDLIDRGWEVVGYALQNGEQRYGFITTGGFVGWWLPEDYPLHTSEARPTIQHPVVVDEAMVERAKAELFRRGIVDVFSVRAALTAALQPQEGK